MNTKQLTAVCIVVLMLVVGLCDIGEICDYLSYKYWMLPVLRDTEMDLRRHRTQRGAIRWAEKQPGYKERNDAFMKDLCDETLRVHELAAEGID